MMQEAVKFPRAKLACVIYLNNLVIFPALILDEDLNKFSQAHRSLNLLK